MNTKTIRMSTIVRKARDIHLWNGNFYDNTPYATKYSCDAIGIAFDTVTKYRHGYDSVLEKIDNKLLELGCNVRSPTLFDDIKNREDQQAARFMWLSFVIEATKNVKLKL